MPVKYLTCSSIQNYPYQIIFKRNLLCFLKSVTIQTQEVCYFDERRLGKKEDFGGRIGIKRQWNK